MLASVVNRALAIEKTTINAGRRREVQWIYLMVALAVEGRFVRSKDWKISRLFGERTCGEYAMQWGRRILAGSAYRVKICLSH